MDFWNHPGLFHNDLKVALEWTRKRRNFNPKEWIAAKTKMFNEYMSKFGLKACLCNCSAMKEEGSPIKKVIGVAQPIHSTSIIQNRVYELPDAFPGVKVITIDQTKIYDVLKETIENATQGVLEGGVLGGITGKGFAKGQLRSYMRTPPAFYVAQLLAQEGFPCVVVGTANFDEGGYLYYFCKAGDGVSDIQLINELHKSEVFAVANELGVPKNIINPIVSPDLWVGAFPIDDDEVGFSYDFVELYTEYLNMPKKLQKEMMSRFTEDGKMQFEILQKRIVGVHRRNSHKEDYPLNLNVKKLELFKDKTKD